MNAVALLVATAVLGVDYGWHRLPNGEWEYIIQVEPALVQTLVQGQALVSQMPPELQGVRRFRVQVGDGEVPREQLPTTPIGGSVGGIPLPGALGANSGIGGLGPTGGGAGFGGSRANTGLGNWPIGVDPRAMAQLRTYEWVSLEPIELLPLENDFLRQLGGPTPMGQDERPWERFMPPSNQQFGQSSSGQLSSRWPGAGRSGGNLGFSPSVDPRNSSLLPRPAGNEAGTDRDVDQFDLNDEPKSGSGFGDKRTAGAWPPANGTTGGARTTGQLASRGTERGAIEERAAGRSPVSGNRVAATKTPFGSQSPFTTTRHTQGVLTEEVVGAQVWWPLTMTVVLLFASLGGNLYLGWLALDFYRRYRDAAWELRTSDGPSG